MSLTMSPADAKYVVSIDGAAWLDSAPTSVTVGGKVSK